MQRLARHMRQADGTPAQHEEWKFFDPAELPGPIKKLLTRAKILHQIMLDRSNVRDFEKVSDYFAEHERDVASESALSYAHAFAQLQKTYVRIMSDWYWNMTRSAEGKPTWDETHKSP